jgi:hypothetical protein
MDTGGKMYRTTPQMKGTILFLVPTSDGWQEAKLMQEGNMWGVSSDEEKSLAFLPTSDVWQ